MITNAIFTVKRAAWTFLTSSVSFVLDFSRASTLAWRLLTDALQSETSGKSRVHPAAAGKVKRGLAVNLRCLFSSST